MLAGDAGEVGLAGLAGLEIDGVGQIGEKPADDPDVFGADGAGGLGGGHVGQHRLQVLAGHRGARSQVVGFIQAAAGLAAADAQPVGQHVGPRLGAQVDRAGLGGELVGQPVIDGGLAAVNGLQPVLDGEHFGSGQGVERQRRELGLGGLEPVEGGRDGLSIRYRTRTHTSNTSSNHRQIPNDYPQAKPK